MRPPPAPPFPPARCAAPGFSAAAPAAADDHERGGAITHARSAPAPATVSGASAASVEAAGRRKVNAAIWARATDKHGERRARRDGHGRRRPTAQATRAADSPRPRDRPARRWPES